MTDKFVVGIGEVLWDMLPTGRKIGGAPANFAYHVSQFGFNGCVVSAVGHDELGDEIVKSFGDKSLNMMIQRVPFETGTVQVTIDDAGVPAYDIRQNVAWDNIRFNDELKSLANNTVAVCFGSLAQRNEVTRKTIDDFLDNLPDSAHIVFDINLRQNFYTKEIIENSIRRCNILKINDEELSVLRRMFNLGSEDIVADCMAMCAMFNVSILILTCGEKGSYVFSGSSVSYLPTPKVKVKDTVGAGDSFTAAFVSSILQNKTIAEAHKTAVDISAFVCTQEGAMPHLPLLS